MTTGDLKEGIVVAKKKSKKDKVENAFPEPERAVIRSEDSEDEGFEDEELASLKVVRERGV